MSILSRTLILGLAVAIVGLLNATPVRAIGSLRTVAFTEPAGDAEQVVRLSSPSINDCGQLTFTSTLVSSSGGPRRISSGVEANRGLAALGQLAELSTPTVIHRDDLGLFRESDGQLDLLLRQGAAAPGLGAEISLQRLSQAKLSPDGVVAFYGVLTGEGIDEANDLALYATLPDGGFRLIARDGDAISSAGGELSINQLRTYRYADGRAAFGATIKEAGVTTNNNDAFFVDTESGLQMVLREGVELPGLGEGIVLRDRFGSLTFINAVANGQGHFATQSKLVDTVSGLPSRDVIVANRGGEELEVVTQWGDAVPQVSASATVDAMSRPLIGSSGHIAFTVRLDGTELLNPQAVFVDDLENNRRLVVQSFDEVPGTSDGTIFRSLEVRDINADGRVALVSRLSSPTPNKFALFSDGLGQELRMVAGEGEPAPGTEYGTVFAGSPSSPSYYYYDFGSTLNTNGQVAFIHRLFGPAVDEKNDVGIFAQDIHGDLHLIARTGDAIDVSSDPLSPDVRTISRLSFDTSLGFNDLGQLAFQARFDDGSDGIFVSNLVAVPEPPSHLLIWLVVMVVGICRLRR